MEAFTRNIIPTPDRITVHPIFSKVKIEKVDARGTHPNAELIITYPPPVDRRGIPWPMLETADYYQFGDANATSPPTDYLIVRILGIDRTLVIDKRNTRSREKRAKPIKYCIRDRGLWEEWEPRVKRRKMWKKLYFRTRMVQAKKMQPEREFIKCTFPDKDEAEIKPTGEVKGKKPVYKSAVTVMDVMNAVVKVLKEPIQSRHLFNLMDGDISFADETPVHEKLTKDSAFRGISRVSTTKESGTIVLEVAGFTFDMC
ncbi:hypothetical protein AA313_de0207234 [Arthrobotrys entomopaga]|nr:hypothetical protein AA313_de0207234 [Arthrobotrys entomopaga]